MNNGKFFAGLALGALVGSALSCFAHSNRGRKLRRDIYDTIQDLEEDAYDFAHRAKHKAEKVTGDVRYYNSSLMKTPFCRWETL